MASAPFCSAPSRMCKSPADVEMRGAALCVPSRPLSIAAVRAVVLIVAGALRPRSLKRAELVDFVVPRTAAVRFLAHEPLYRPDDGHYQYKYLPAFAAFMVPFTWVSKRVGEVTWFALTVAMAWAFVRLVARSPCPIGDCRRGRSSGSRLLLTGKFLVKELAFGQFNLPLGLLLIGAVIAAQHGRGLAAGAAIAAGVFVKPYALVLVPWLAWTLGWRPFVLFALVAGGRTASAGRHLRLEREPDAAARVVSHRHRHDGTEPARCREHLVRLDVGEVDRAGPQAVAPCARLRSWPPSRRAAPSCRGADRWPSPTTSRARTSSCSCRSCRRRDGTTCSCSGCPLTCVLSIDGAICRVAGARVALRASSSRVSRFSICWGARSTSDLMQLAARQRRRRADCRVPDPFALAGYRVNRFARRSPTNLANRT